jgi:hypothetical protein
MTSNILPVRPAPHPQNEETWQCLLFEPVLVCTTAKAWLVGVFAHCTLTQPVYTGHLRTRGGRTRARPLPACSGTSVGMRVWAFLSVLLP